jgi:mannose-6-phosphate isomerase-like protein (cupin superfamily)
MSQQVHDASHVHDIPNRPGMRGRNLIATEHGVTSLFVAELFMDHGSFIPLHTHITDEVFFVAEGELVMVIGEERVVAQAESVVRIEAGVPHGVRNEAAGTAHALTAAAWNRATFLGEATTYLEGLPRSDEG